MKGIKSNKKVINLMIFVVVIISIVMALFVMLKNNKRERQVMLAAGDMELLKAFK